MTQGHGWSLTFATWGTSTPCFLPAFTGAFYEFISIYDKHFPNAYNSEKIETYTVCMIGECDMSDHTAAALRPQSAARSFSLDTREALRV